MWHLIAHESELEKPGDYVCFGWSPDSQVAVTNFGGNLVAWDNRCWHRGTKIYDQHRGNRVAPACAYHGRIQTPNRLNVLYPVSVRGGFVFVSDDVDDKQQRSAYFPCQPPKLKFHSEFFYTYECDWKVAIENALDSEHVVKVHGNSLAQLQIAPVKLNLYPDGSSMELFESGIWDRLDRLEENLAPRIFEPDCGFDYAHSHFFPYAALSTTRGWTWSLQNYFPWGDNKTLFIHRLYVAEGVNKALADSASSMNRSVFLEDGAIVEQVPSTRYGLLEPHEKRIEHFRSFVDSMGRP